jgi:ligand-binding SRPBCC domain-containing protein
MPVVHVETSINAPIQQCFDLMRDVDVHTRSTSGTHERAVGGKTRGLLDTGDEITWEAVHFGIKQRLTVRVTRCEPPRVFEDSMVRGAFKSFTHIHSFHEQNGATLMVDDFAYRSPFGPLGWLADKLFLGRYMRRFLVQRAQALKQMAEAVSRGS